MDDSVRSEQAIEVAGLRVARDAVVGVASLRYFSVDGTFAQTLQRVTGLAPPGVLKAVAGPAPAARDWILAWRSPTEAILLSADHKALSGLGAALSNCTDGCLVDQTGGLCVLRASGPRITDLLIRLGGWACVPALGESRRGRMADVPVLAVCMDGGETLLIVERVYCDHLLAWIRETAADLT